MFDINKIDRNIELFIFDIYIAIHKITHVSNRFDNVQDLLHDFMAWDSIIREFEIIGEATKYLLRDNLLQKNYQEIVDFRNQITHAYFGIDQDTVWEIVNYDLKHFEQAIMSLIKNIEPSLKKELIESYIEDNHYLDFIIEALRELNHD